ncbi:RAB11-binding protein RELCH [Trichinella pseudospiralis]
MLGFLSCQLFYLTPNWRSAFEMGPVVHSDSREMKTASKQCQPLDGGCLGGLQLVYSGLGFVKQGSLVWKDAEVGRLATNFSQQNGLTRTSCRPPSFGFNSIGSTGDDRATDLNSIGEDFPKRDHLLRRRFIPDNYFFNTLLPRSTTLLPLFYPLIFPLLYLFSFFCFSFF